jgi:hypothetical protein
MTNQVCLKVRVTDSAEGCVAKTAGSAKNAAGVAEAAKYADVP